MISRNKGKKTRERTKLTNKERKFCEFFEAGNSKGQAAIMAGFSERSASNTACRLMKKDNVIAYIEEL
jgi:phage terminase small subunit